ncbi:uncharacterized protein LOC131724794 [Acipenser ruthenus]|uniref:uncharacterized protein LOC131724794 n=1 Tax=Acipenser ruthenus TaxID=7906 RepID=UPI0027409DFC|nr:uncharacterized protein LOC131724794 [Acipenser ruthenus]
MPLVNSLGPLESYIGAEEGVAFKADNNMFWSCIERSNIYNIEAAKSTKDAWCRFLVSKAPNGKILLRDRRGVYLSRIDRSGIQHIEAAKTNPDKYCEFSIFTEDGKVVLQADNGRFISRIYRENQNIEAAKEGPDECCRFSTTIGDIISPTFQIVKVDFGKVPDLIDKPSVVSCDVYVNRTSVKQQHTFSLTWETKVTETTSWKHAWGFSSTVSADVLFASVEATVSYNGEYGKESTKEKTISQSRSTEVTVPPHTKITAKLIAHKDDDAEIPFTATVKKVKSDGRVEILKEEGTWKGVLYENVMIEVDEEQLTKN